MTAYEERRAFEEEVYMPHIRYQGKGRSSKMTSLADLMSQDDFWDAMKHEDWQERVAAIRLRLDEQRRWNNRHNKPAVYGHDIYYRKEE